jgi:hypothetical protein
MLVTLAEEGKGNVPHRTGGRIVGLFVENARLAPAHTGAIGPVSAPSALSETAPGRHRIPPAKCRQFINRVSAPARTAVLSDVVKWYRRHGLKPDLKQSGFKNPRPLDCSPSTPDDGVDVRHTEYRRFPARAGVKVMSPSAGHRP